MHCADPTPWSMRCGWWQPPSSGCAMPPAGSYLLFAELAAQFTPRGRCRQVLWEVGGPGLLVDDHGGPIPLAELLPGAFGPGDLPEPGDPGA